jgi:hypothetical protein
VEIHWPSGQVEKLNLTAADCIFTVEEGKGVTDELCTAYASAGKP